MLCIQEFISMISLSRISPYLLLLFLDFVSPAFVQGSQICTVIKGSGKEYVGCNRNGLEYILAKPVNNIQSFKAIDESAHNPGCYNLNTNGVAAICTYKR